MVLRLVPLPCRRKSASACRKPVHRSVAFHNAIKSTCTTYTTLQNVGQQELTLWLRHKGRSAIAINLILLILVTVRLCRNCTRPLELSSPPTRPTGLRDCASTYGF